MKLDPRHPASHLLLIAAVTLAAYGRTLGRYFVSEDFVILRLLAEDSFWGALWSQLTGPWLGISFVTFYRPISTLVLQLEALAWGAWAPGYLAFHFSLHLANVALLHRLARRLTLDREPAVPFAVALLFAVYPLHPNTVIFIASFATLFSTTAGLACMLLFLRPGRRTAVASAACFALALGCYEGAAVLPLLLLTADLLSARGRGAPAGWRPLVARHLPFAALLAAYFVLRQAALGAVLGGYRQLQSRLASGDFEAFLDAFQLSWTRLLYPSYAADAGDWARVALATTLAAGTVWSVARLRSGGSAPRLWLLAMVWIPVSQLPFGAVDVVPANGRYWYLTAAGLSLLVAAGSSALAPARRRGPVVIVVALALAAIYLGLLRRYADLHLEAGRTARAVQSELLHRAPRDPETPVFVFDHPRFVRGDLPVNVAQVFHWGLSDALQPPFVEREVRVYPLPPLPPEAFRPLLERPDLGPVWRWDAAAEELRPLTLDVPAPLQRIAAPTLSDDGRRLSFEATGAARYRLVVLARGHPAFPVVEAAAGEDGRIEAALPIDFIRSMQRLYAGEILWWIVAFDDAGQPTGFSAVRALGTT